MRFGLLLTTVFGPLLTPVALAPAAPVPSGAEPRYFYPTRVGDRMVYKRDDNDEYTTTVAKVEKVEGAFHVTTNQILDDGTQRLDEQMEVSSKGLRLIRWTYRRTLPHPYWSLKVTPDADATWTSKWAIFTNDGIDTFEDQENTVVGWETVEVPAGKFRAVRVDRVGTHQMFKSKRTTWYALGQGYF